MRGLLSRLEKYEKCTFRKFSIAYVFYGLFQGILRLTDVIAKKTLHATDFEIAVLSMVWPVANVFSVYFGELMAGKDKKNFLLFAGIFGRLSLVLIFFVKTPWEFILLLLLVYSANAIILPAQNSLLQSNLRWDLTGSVFGYLTAILSFFVILSAYVAGKVMDMNESYFRWVLFAAGILGFIHIAVLSTIKQRRFLKGHGKFDSRRILKPFIDGFRLLKEDKDYGLFQLFYFIYGMGFLMVMPAIPKLLVVKLAMTYTLVSIARVFMSQTGKIVFSPWVGRVFDRISPVKFTGITFFVMGLYALTLGLVLLVPPFLRVPLVFVAFFIFSIGMTGINLSWNLSSIHFAKEHDASRYQGVHVALTAVRGILGPLLGYFVMKFFPLQYVFFTSFLFFLLASSGMLFFVNSGN